MNTSPKSTEAELVAKLLRTWHLSVAERKSLATGYVSGHRLIEQLQHDVAKDGQYPRGWAEDTQYDGGLLTCAPNGSCSIYWKSEVSMGRYELLEIQHFTHLREACITYAKRFFGTSIDGVLIRWDS